MFTYIYAFIDPRTNEVRYIGKTCRPFGQRVKEHLKPSQMKHYRGHWLAQLLKQGLSPRFALLDTVEGNGETEEQWWIQHYLVQGARLTNLTHGGEPARRIRVTWREKVTEGLKKYYRENPEAKKKVAERLAGYSAAKKGIPRPDVAERTRKLWREQPEKMLRTGWHHSEETKRKMSLAGKGKPSKLKGKPNGLRGTKKSAAFCAQRSAYQTAYWKRWREAKLKSGTEGS